MKLGLSGKTFIGFAIGIGLGCLFGERAVIIKPIGTIFLQLIKMVVVPMIFCSIVVGIANLGNISRLKKLGGKVLGLYCVTSLLATVVGLGAALLLQPGAGFDSSVITGGQQYKVPQLSSFGQIAVSLFPDNPIKAMADGNLMQVIVFAVFTAVGILSAGEKGQTLLKVFDSGAETMYKVTETVLKFSPYGVCALMAASVGEYGLKLFGPLLKLVLTDYAGLIAVLFLVYLPEVVGFARIGAIRFFRSISKVWLMTASTTSSAGTLPVTTGVTQKDFNVSSKLASFSLPVGATVNMDGACVYYAAVVVFVSQIYNMPLSIDGMLMLVFMTTVISIGSPGIPGGGIVMTILLLSNMGLPADIVGMIAGMYRILDVGHTTLNVTGDVVQTLVVARSEGLFTYKEEEAEWERRRQKEESALIGGPMQTGPTA